ncbi:MAG: daunorubicin resistance protein DrrA family ABC transporter ATP-binding protein [Pyrobaculum arsenaticum]|uniref:Daunorubicin resistance ABC transporter ATPase subunit n=2 Tax=Pyrobaculum arsenaticum TaxID=121277 RepID=A4WMV1_PYRAR|nr:daunorubicin resistance protein DrrA family ABC transporter ATP-binding protein [Pyrobaculum arsenaticum]ABP51718.1 daunorubicin resistance ABC transporter ATPase subunit [Pyrobaculum arsenaticum DSM 13514]MCY0890088.1 daunorubicin resistance protein DrrA family ABC transporter ATP-binding protein [Pyrobaculum arsenaticum]NYR16039.1 daunorubicin resistance protein DrrA family ABC transporter ATP-binding protein [Pyrobaculum arsenaticum]
MNAIVVQNLVKRYGEVEALRGISFEVARGEVFGLLGPNGAGKTTTIKILTGLTKPTSGRALVAGFDVVEEPMEVKKRIGWVASEVIVDDELTGWENLEIQARLAGVKNWRERAAELLKYFGLSEAADRPVGKYSTGMRKRLEVAMALLHAPEILFMDEPTVGLDVGARVGLWEVVRQINKDFGVTVLLTTHYMEEAEQLCNRIAIINKGVLVATGTPDELKAKYGVDVIELEVDRPVDTAKLAAFGEVAMSNGKVLIKTRNAEEKVAEVVKAVEGVKSVRVKKASLDTVFLNLTGATFEGEQADIKRLYMKVRMARR